MHLGARAVVGSPRPLSVGTALAQLVRQQMSAAVAPL